MNRRRADAAVGILIVAILLGGGALSWQAYQQQRAVSQMMPMMGSSIGGIHGPDPLWYGVGTVLAAGVVAGLYLTLRPDLPQQAAAAPGHTGSPAATGTEWDEPPIDDPTADSVDPTEQSRGRVLDLLPEDERRILEPVLTSPGITQIELRDRSDFSKSKVSQTVTDLEKRGLLSRERQGRTYRVYPSDDLREP